MRTWVVVSGVLSAAVMGGVAMADTASDRAAAIVVFPRVEVQRLVVPSKTLQVQFETDTVIQISNTSNELVQLKCFYVNANSHCSTTGSVCSSGLTGGMGQRCFLDDEVCQPGWSETDFHVTLTAQQPLAWRASQGLATDDIPLDGTLLRGPGGQSNAGTRVPPVTVESLIPPGVPVPAGTVFEAFIGELKCIAVDEDGRAIARNVLKGEATTTTFVEEAIPAMGLDFTFPDVEKYSAIGIQAVAGDANGDRVLELGGDAGEYNGCPNVLVVDHFFDSQLITSAVTVDNLTSGFDLGEAQLPEEISAAQFFLGGVSELTLVPCSEDFAAQVPGKVVAQFLVFNEFEQRFSTSATVDCFFERFLSNIDTPDNFRSIFSAQVAGTATGQTRIRGVGGGLLGILREESGRGIATCSSALNLHTQGERAEADRIIVPEP